MSELLANPSSMVETARKPLRPGDLIAGRFELQEEIGRGGYAVVFRALDRETGAEVAVKTIRPVTPRPQESLLRFKREAALINRLKHPNTVRIFEWGMEGEVYIAMELLRGYPLSDELDRNRTVSPERALHICREVLKSLSEAHDLGIVHRDLKPENVFLVQHSDGTESIKVLDFGIAKLTNDAEQVDPHALTMQGRAMGTPNYMSPEQARGMDLTPHSDLYTVGVLLYEMLIGKPPYAGGSAMDIMLRHVNSPVPKVPDPKFRGTPIEKAIRKALQKDPVKRFNDAAEMLAALGGTAAVPRGQLRKAERLNDELAATPAEPRRAASLAPSTPQAGTPSAALFSAPHAMARREVANAAPRPTAAPSSLQGGAEEDPATDGAPAERAGATALARPHANLMLWGLGAVLTLIVMWFVGKAAF
jgi:serine/threonine protein kinase